MAIEQTVVINTDTKSLADLRKEITSIQAQLDLTPTGTKEYDDLVVRLRQAKGEIKDFKEATKGLDPDQRAAKLVNSFQGMTGAIQAAAGALTLFGGSGKELEEVEKNLLGIIAIGGGVQQTIEGFNDAADVIGPSFTKLGASIKGAFTTAEGGVNKFRVALAAVGIGVLIAGVTALVTNFDDLKQAIAGVNNNLSFTDEEIKNISVEVGKSVANVEVLTNKVKDNTLAEKDRKEALEKLQELYPNYFKNIGTDINNTGALTTAKDKLSEALLREAKVRTLQDRLAKVYAEDIEEEIQLTQKLEKNTLDLARLRTQEAEARAKDDVDVIVATQQAINRVEQNISDINERRSAITKGREKDAKVILDLINKEELAIKSLGGATVVTADKTVKATEKALTVAEKEVIAITNATALKQRAYEQDIENLNKAKNKELEGAIDSATKREGIEIKYAALQVERGKKLGNDLLQVVKDSEKRLVKADETVLTKRAEVQLQGNKIINQQDLESINAAIKQREDATKKSNAQILENLQTNLTNAERTLEQEQSIYGKLIEEYKQLNADNYETVFDDQETFYNFLVDRLKQYGIEVNRETAEQIRQRGLADFKANEESQLLQDQFFKQAIDALRKNGEEGNAEADRLEKERKEKFDQNQQAKLDSAISFGQQEIDIEEEKQKKLQLIDDAAFDAAKSLFSDLSQLNQIYASDNEAAAKQAFEQQKLFAIASATIDTYLAAQKAFTSQIIPGDPSSLGRAQIAAAIAVAAGLGRIAVIAAQKYNAPSSGGGGGSLGSVGGGEGSNALNPFSTGGFGGGGTTVLPPRLAPKRDPNEFQADTTGQFGGGGVTTPIVRAYVLSGDVTDAQVADQRLNQKRKL